MKANKLTINQKIIILKDLNEGFLGQYVRDKYQLSNTLFYKTFIKSYRGEWRLRGRDEAILLLDDLEKAIDALVYAKNSKEEKDKEKAKISDIYYIMHKIKRELVDEEM